MYQHAFLLSIHPKHVDGFWRQRNCSPNFHYLASSALPSISTTWQAMHTCMIWYLASRACTYRFCKLASMSGIGPAPISAPARWEHLPNPEIALRASCAFLQNASLYSCCCWRSECYNRYPFPQMFASAYSFLFTGTQIALW